MLLALILGPMLLWYLKIRIHDHGVEGILNHTDCEEITFWRGPARGNTSVQPSVSSTSSFVASFLSAGTSLAIVISSSAGVALALLRLRVSSLRSGADPHHMRSALWTFKLLPPKPR